MELYLLRFLNGITDRKHLFSLLDSSYGPWTSKHKNINIPLSAEKKPRHGPYIEMNYGYALCTQNTYIHTHQQRTPAP